MKIKQYCGFDVLRVLTILKKTLILIKKHDNFLGLSFRDAIEKLKKISNNKGISLFAVIDQAYDLILIDRPMDYPTWIKQVEYPFFKTVESYDHLDGPILSIILFDDQNNNVDLMKSIESVLKQTISRYELIIVTQDTRLESQLQNRSQNIKIHLKSNKKYFFESVNSALPECSGDFVVFICAGDCLSSYAVEIISTYRVQNLSVRLIVTDEDFLDDSGNRCVPFFKPDWNLDYLLNYNYFSQGIAFEKKLFIELGGFDAKLNDPHHTLALKAAALLSDGQIGHINKILFHFYQHNNQYVKGKALRVKFEVPKPTPLVSVIIPTKDELESLKTCINGLLNKTSYENMEIIVIDNQSQQRETVEYLNELKIDHKVFVLEYNKSFNYSEMNNLAVKQAKGSLLCFLNNDVSIIKDDWLIEMVSHASRPEIGCVGAKLFYPDGTIQHAGVILGLKGYASHAHKGFAGDDTGYYNRLTVTHNVSAVTAACLVLRKGIFEDVDGFDDINLKVAYNDIDLCLKVREAGYRNLFTPHAQLIHHESKSRGKKRNKKQQKQLKEESKFFRKKWGDLLTTDPAYNKNLTLLTEDFSLGIGRLDG